MVPLSSSSLLSDCRVSSCRNKYYWHLLLLYLKASKQPSLIQVWISKRTYLVYQHPARCARRGREHKSQHCSTEPNYNQLFCTEIFCTMKKIYKKKKLCVPASALHQSLYRWYQANSEFHVPPDLACGMWMGGNVLINHIKILFFPS